MPELQSNKLKLYKIRAESRGTNCYRSNSPSFEDSTLRFDVLLKDALRIQQCVVKLDGDIPEEIKCTRHTGILSGLSL